MQLQSETIKKVQKSDFLLPNRSNGLLQKNSFQIYLNIRSQAERKKNHE